MTTPASIALFVHRDPGRAADVMDALAACEMADRSEITVYCDGPRSADETGRVERVRAIARESAGFGGVEVVEYADHRGRSRMIIDAVTATLSRREVVIVVEDDLRVAPAFLRFMNEGLQRYATDERVISLCGFGYGLRSRPAETYFLPGAHCWGWATWQRGWQLFSEDADELVRDLVRRDLVYAFDGGGAEPLTQALQEAATDPRELWSLCWMASAILHGKLTLYPGRSLVAHADFSGANSSVAPVFNSPLSEVAIGIQDVPVESDKRVVRELRESLMRWRCKRNPKLRLFAMLMQLLPQRTEEAIYTALIRSRLRRSLPQQGHNDNH